MYPLIRTSLLSILLFGSTYLYSQLIANGRYLSVSNHVLHAYSEIPSTELVGKARDIIATTRQRALLYERLIESSHLIDGMVVNRGASGEMLDQCDSLLFSSIRYVSLAKLSWLDEASKAWAAIESSKDRDAWLRHPRCYRSISRDMLLGLLIAMTRSPPRFEQHLSQLMFMIHQNNGFFGTGPVYVSYLSPGLARLMRGFAKRDLRIAPKIPDLIAAGYSTAEIEVLLNPAGYTSHLGGLTAWLEMELNDQGLHLGDSRLSFLGAADSLVAPFGKFSLTDQRLEWITDRLMKADQQNLFFRYLRFRSVGGLSNTVRLKLLNELITMRQFPADRLPMDCDRHSDYLWQRANKSANYDPIPCQIEFSGVDFLWMAALLLEGLDSSSLTSH
ncbi:MAG: hypothetical protein FJ146_04520 [Deltaproteobacteria bacterium]|nr:hypothetical protein [Deltaproteobacteria bacterium]